MFRTEEGDVVHVPMIPQEVYAIMHKGTVVDILEKVDLYNYFDLPPAGIDCRRAYELMTSIDTQGIAHLTDMQGQNVQVLISPELIKDALNLPADGTLLRYKKDQDVSAFRKNDSSATFADMVMPQAIFPTRVYHQFFHVANKRPACYTKPNHAVASSLSWAFTQPDPVTLNHAQYICFNLIHMKKQDKVKYMAAPEMLTRIAYKAIGARDQLPEAPHQRVWLADAESSDKESKPKPRAPPLRTGLRRRLQTVGSSKKAKKEKTPSSSSSSSSQDSDEDLSSTPPLSPPAATTSTKTQQATETSVSSESSSESEEEVQKRKGKRKMESEETPLQKKARLEEWLKNFRQKES